MTQAVVAQKLSPVQLQVPDKSAENAESRRLTIEVVPQGVLLRINGNNYVFDAALDLVRTQPNVRTV